MAFELGLRVALIALSIHVLPRVFTGDINNFLSEARHFSLVDPARMPYRYVPPHHHAYEFPPLTVPFLALERVAFGSKAVFTWLFALSMAGFELGSLAVLRRTWPEHRRSLDQFWYGAVVPLGLVCWFRHDFLAVFFATTGLVALVGATRRHPSMATSITAGFAAKLWPAVLIPCLAVRRRWREAATASAACLAVVVAWWAFSPAGFRRFLQFRAGNGLEIESVPASLQLLGSNAHFAVRSGAWVIDAGGGKGAGTVLNAALVVFVVAVLAWAWFRRSVDVVALGGALTVAAFLFSRIISPQYLVWPAPFVALLWVRGRRLVGWVSAAAAWCTVGYLLFFDSALVKGNRLVAAVVVARNVLLLALLVALVQAIAGPDGEGAGAGSAGDDRLDVGAGQPSR